MSESAFGIDHGSGFSKGLTPKQSEAKLVLDRLAARRKGGFGFKTTTPQDAMPLSKPFTEKDGIPGQHVNLFSGGSKRQRVAKAGGGGAFGLTKLPGQVIDAAHNAGKAVGGAGKTFGGQFKTGFKSPMSQGVLKPTVPNMAGQKAGQATNFLNANKKPIAGGVAAGGAAGLVAGNHNAQNKRLSQYR